MERLTECQKEFLFNSRYNNEHHPAYKALKYHCKKTDLRMEIDVDEITDEEYLILNRKIYEAIFDACSKCYYGK